MTHGDIAAPERPDDIFDKKGAARYLRCSVRQIERLCELRLLDYAKVGNRVRITRAALDDYLDASTTRATRNERRRKVAR
jgi:excisionase family DNA binding protein